MAENYPWGIGGSESSGAGTGGPQGQLPSDNDEDIIDPSTLPWQEGGSGAGTGGPLADQPSDDATIGCRFNTYPFGYGGSEGQSPTPTYYLLTECNTSATKYTTGALTTNILTSVGKVIEVSEYEGGWLVSVTTSPGTTEALTITDSHVDCDAYNASIAAPCDIDLTGSDPPDGLATSYTAPKINIGAGTNWEDHNESLSYIVTTEDETWEWDADEDGWHWQSDKVSGNAFGKGVSVSGGKKYVYDGSGGGLTGNSNHDLKIYTKSGLQNLDGGTWNLAPGRAWTDIEDGACAWGFDFKIWTEGSASSRGGFFYMKTTGDSPAGTYTLFLIHDKTAPGGTHEYSTLPDTSITVS